MNCHGQDDNSVMHGSSPGQMTVVWWRNEPRIHTKAFETESFRVSRVHWCLNVVFARPVNVCYVATTIPLYRRNLET